MLPGLNFDDPATEIALFRYGLIAPLIHLPPASGKLEGALRQVAATAVVMPNSRRTTVSLASVRRWLKAYQRGGFAALLPKARSDIGQPRAFDKAVLARAVELRLAQPDRTTPMIAEHLKREGLSVNTHTLTTHLRNAGQTRRLLAPADKIRRRFERDAPNDLWQGDTLQGPWLPDVDKPSQARRAHLVAFIDDHSRLVPYAEWFFDERLPRLERVFKLALLRRGVPKAIYVDNGSIYHATQFGAACATLGVDKRHTPVRDAPAKGKIEKFFQNVRLSFLPEWEASKLTTLSDLNAAFLAWLEQLYHARVHSETGQSPFERFTAGPDPRTVDPETIQQAFLWRITRHVSRTNSIELQGNRYTLDLGRQLSGQKVELRFDPFDLSKVDVYLHKQLLARVAPVFLKRQWHLKVDGLVAIQPALRTHAGEDFLVKLRAEHERELRARLGTTRFTQLSESS